VVRPFATLLPVQRAILVAPRERLNGPETPDITIKYLHNNTSYTILTMENKRASGWHLGSHWKSALADLAESPAHSDTQGQPQQRFHVSEAFVTVQYCVTLAS
jgi:hypothetical protein